MADANTMIRCIIGDSEQKIQELEDYDRKLNNAIKRGSGE